MGTESSKLLLPQTEDDAIEVTDSYVLKQGFLSNSDRCSVFSGSESPHLLALAKNLKTHRHPCILKYLSSGEKKERLYLVTEHVEPLTVVISKQSALQICVGLHSIVTALSFLHKNAQTSHNNVCTASIFVTAEGVWKLSGLEFMRKFSETTNQSLREMRPRRYENAVPPEENNGRVLSAVVDVFGLGVLANELLKNIEDDQLPSLKEFRSFCLEQMLHVDPHARAKLSDVIAHPFFSHDFIRIHKFLVELPLKTTEEKTEFFRELEQQLKVLPEGMVASQLLPLLLSRLVVLDSAAQQHLLPLLLRPRSADHPDGAMFKEDIFKEFVVPRLLHMFCVRDASVRLLLLSYLPGFLHCFTLEQLRSRVLPELLVGVKDVDDELVIATLHALATMVGVLGGAAVVGGRRARLFSDGRPAARRPRKEGALPERPSPDGGEDSMLEDTEAWSDWEQQSEKDSEPAKDFANSPIIETCLVSSKDKPKPRLSTELKAPVTLADIDALDIKTNTPWRGTGDDDFFRDMEPVISKAQIGDVKEDNIFKVNELESAGEEWDSFEGWDGVPE